MNIVKDWKTTLLGIAAAVLVVAGIMWPDKIDASTQEVVNTALGEIVSGVGALVAVITGLFAKDAVE